MDPAPQPTRSGGAWTPGSQVGDYRLDRLLGSGGMGSVHQATHQETGAVYALKTIAVRDPDLLLRFQREVEAQARVDRHPNVLRIHHGGSQAGRVYFAMDLAAGGSHA